MLDKNTKKQIDNARDTLVGVLPLPTDQIELITIALIYKFMDDQDEELRQVGFDEKFFKGTLKEYSWQQLMSNQISADQRVTKFINGIEQIQKTEDIPQLFKEIFQNAFLKFRDGKVLQRFLDIINGFNYSHSENLGNAFEYLLMTMGAQGDNGQFRTPRNIIDFIVDVVNPLKNDTILDPACGTGGFLVSAFKHVLRTNTKGYENSRFTRNHIDDDKLYSVLGDLLTTTERNVTEKNISGYDNTPLMVRLARVNLYLHHFNNPKIYEYNTLNNDSRWKERFNCIFANPPFMTPKGGIDPHDKFRLQANRTEVLFSSYILQHLNPENGKAGFIVPEGIIFSNSNDFIALRRWLIYEAGLWAVASLPAGVFQPYSGVKTSILFIDKEIAKNRTDVLLVKLENDGFSLNTNRSKIDENDLPNALHFLELCKTDIGAFKKELETNDNNFTAQLRLLNRDEFAKLSPAKSVSSTWAFCRKAYEVTIKQIKSIQSSSEDTIKQQDKVDRKKQDFNSQIGIPEWPTDLVSFKMWFEQTLKDNVIDYGLNLVKTKLPEKLKSVLESQRDFNLGFNKYADERSNTSKYEFVRLADVADFKRGPFGGSLKKEIFVNEGFLVYEQFHAINNDFTHGRYYIDKNKFDEMKSFEVLTNDILISCSGTMGKVAIIPKSHKKGIINQALLRLRPNNKILPIYLKRVLESEEIQNKYFRNQNGVAIQNVASVAILKEILLPLPPIEVQEQIIINIEQNEKEIEKLKAKVADLRKIIEGELSQVWEE